MSEARKYQAFYTKSAPIVTYMVDKLELEINDLVMEPCAGDGVFIEEIISRDEDVKINIFELNVDAIDTLNKKFCNFPNITITHCNTLLNNNLLLASSPEGTYDKIIANPPYGAIQDSSDKAKLKKTYPNLYVKETYSVFLYKCIQLLKNNGKLTFIIPDTFLNIHSHTGLREYLLHNTKIIELSLFPSSFFPGVNFTR